MKRPPYPSFLVDPYSNRRVPSDLRPRVLIDGPNWLCDEHWRMILEKLNRLTFMLDDPIIVLGQGHSGFGNCPWRFSTLVCRWAGWHWFAHSENQLKKYRYKDELVALAKQRESMIKDVMNAKKKRRHAILFHDGKNKHIKKLIKMCKRNKIKTKIVRV